jgi:hypothetical protein
MMRKQNAAKYAKALQVKDIDFQKQMIIGVSAGVQPTTGYRLEVTQVEKNAPGQGLTVRWTLHAPAPGQPLAQERTHPAAVILVEQFPGKVQFQQAQK